MLFMRPLRSTDDFGLPGPESGSLYFIALDEDKLVGWCRYRRLPWVVKIEEFNDGGDLVMLDGLVRAVLNAMYESGVDRAEMGEKVELARLAALGVPLNGTNCVNSIDDFLNNCKNCKKFGNLL